MIMHFCISCRLGLLWAGFFNCIFSRFLYFLILLYSLRDMLSHLLRLIYQLEAFLLEFLTIISDLFFIFLLVRLATLQRILASLASVIGSGWCFIPFFQISVFNNISLVNWVECSLMFRESRVQSHVESYQKLKKWYLIPPCLTLGIIRYVSRVKWSNLGKGVAPSAIPWCCSYGKGSLRVTLDYSHQLYLLFPMNVISYLVIFSFISYWCKIWSTGD